MAASSRFTLTPRLKRGLSDTLTPVSIYLALRDRYPETLLLESADYRGSENSWSFICAKPMAEFRAQQGVITERFPDGTGGERPLSGSLLSALEEFRTRFQVNPESEVPAFMHSLFGYISYDAVPYIEDISFRDRSGSARIPEVCYRAYRFVIAVNHFRNEIFLADLNPEEGTKDEFSALERLVRQTADPKSSFRRVGDESAAITEEGFLDVVRKCKEHIFRGDVFQIVPSRRFMQPFEGDDFLVYRALRSINPSPYLFYFDFGSFRIMGSSPEAQLIIKGNSASVFPIAGTYRRTGDELSDQQLAQQLAADPKENAEHVMLVDLGRNDLSRNCRNVRVESFREVQFYSHVIHLVSKVTGDIVPGTPPCQVLAGTFPAGTLTGAPKYRAMQILDRFEPTSRGFYGGAIGLLGLGGEMTHAIMIRSFISQDNVLAFQAGAGVVADSVPESELQEVNNKLSALRRALQYAEEIA